MLADQRPAPRQGSRDSAPGSHPTQQRRNI